jgi:hypothetical protein
MENEWKLTRSGPFPNGIRNAIVNLCAALVIREAEALQDTESLVSSVQVAEEVVERAESRDKRGEESHRSVCSAAPAFDWAEDVNVSICAIQVVDGQPTPLANIDTSGDAPPIAHVETTPIASIENASINPNTIATSEHHGYGYTHGFSADLAKGTGTGSQIETRAKPYPWRGYVDVVWPHLPKKERRDQLSITTT